MLSIGRNLFIGLYFSFIGVTIIGTLVHEFGHFIAARKYGYRARIRYAYTHFGMTGLEDSINRINSQYDKELMERVSFPEKQKYDIFVRKLLTGKLWVSAGGPLLTIFVGTIGVLFLFLHREAIKQRKYLSFSQWTIVFLSFFWIRQVAILIIWVVGFLLNGKFSHSGDEIRIAYYLQLPFWFIQVFTGLIGIIVLGIVFFGFIPKQQRLTFLLACVFGGISGYVIWFKLLGPLLLP